MTFHRVLFVPHFMERDGTYNTNLELSFFLAVYLGIFSILSSLILSV